MALRFEWDNPKAESNLRAHGVSFREATTVLGDPLSITISDPDHSADEMRFIDIGVSHLGRLLVVIVHRARQSNPAYQCATRSSQ